MYLHVLMTASVCQQPCRHCLWILARGTSQAVVGHCHPDEANMFPPSVAVTRQLWSLAEHMRLKATTRIYRLDGIDLDMLITIHIRLQKVLGLRPEARSEKSGSDVIVFQTDPVVTNTYCSTGQERAGQDDVLLESLRHLFHL